MQKVVYSLVIPCYNESGNLELLVERCSQLINKRDDVEVVLVNNGSLDRTGSILDELLAKKQNSRLRSVHIKVNQGYGFGILTGLQECAGDFLGWTHADLQTDPLDFLDAITVSENSKSQASTFVKGKRYGRPVRDVIFTWGMAFVEWIILGVRMWDINAQPTMFSKDFFLSWEIPPKDFSLDLFVYREAIRRGLCIERFPVIFNTRAFGVGHNDALSSKLRYSWRTLQFSLAFRSTLKNKD